MGHPGGAQAHGRFAGHANPAGRGCRPRRPRHDDDPRSPPHHLRRLGAGNVAKFKYSALTPDGATVTGIEEAVTVGGARRALLERSLSPLELQEKKSVMQFELTQKKVSRRALMHFSRQMAVFMRAGIPVLEALEVMLE